jgi:hypothetical protein
MKIKVPLSSVTIERYPMAMTSEGDGPKKITPEVNDPVDFRIEGVVTSISGDTAEIDVRFLNGERPGGAAAVEDDKAKKDEAEMSEDDMMAAAEEADAAEYGDETEE